MYALDDPIGLWVFHGCDSGFYTVICKIMSEVLFELRPVVLNYRTRSRVPREPVILQLACHGRAVLVTHRVKFERARGRIDEGDDLQLPCGAFCFIYGNRPWTDEVHAHGIPWDRFRAFRG